MPTLKEVIKTANLSDKEIAILIANHSDAKQSRLDCAILDETCNDCEDKNCPANQ